MIVPVSLTGDTVLVYSKDPALDAPPADASEEELKSWGHKLTVARDTGDWSGVIKPGHQPTRFTVRRIRGTVWRKIEDRVQGGEVGAMEAMALVFRAALKSVENLGDVKVTHADEPDVGPIASASIVDTLDEIDPGIVAELGLLVLQRQRSTPGK